MLLKWFMVSFVARLTLCIEHDFKGFDDSILFSINWPGVIENIDTIVDKEAKREETKTNHEVMQILTTDLHTYQCHLPEVVVNEPLVISDYEGPSPLELLDPLFSEKICSYRLESYWTYEVCHGRYIRQFHEERDGKQIKTQEYYLGHWNADKHKELEKELKAAKDRQEKPKTTKVGGVALPQVELVMEDGTPCDLSEKRRLTRVQYVCYSQGKHEIYSYKETITCEYEIIVLSPLVCDHPQFKPKDTSENVINCIPFGDNVPKKPKGIVDMEKDIAKLMHQTAHVIDNRAKDAKDVLAVLKVQKIEKDGETHLKFELHPLSEGDEAESTSKVSFPEKSGPVLNLLDDSPVKAFLKGDNCLTGGSGWWKYEFCYGRHVSQYHVDRTGGTTTLMLGRFDKKAHLDWVRENNKMRKPDSNRKSISHFYSHGDICDKTGRPRQTEVKLKCLENTNNAAQVSLYLLEPRTCHYILGVESPLICDILPYADENGLVNMLLPLMERDSVQVQDENDDLESSVDKMDE